MTYGMYISAAGAEAQSKRIETISNNLANVDTVGFKRQLAVLKARHAEAVEQGQLTSGAGAIEDIGGGVFTHETVTDFSQGLIKKTDVPTDVAIVGDGFFMVQKDDEQLLTRAGNFAVANGRLVTPDGFTVLTADGGEILINPSGGPLRISNRGDVTQLDPQSGQYLPLGQLAMVKPQSKGDLVKMGQNLFRPLAGTTPLTPGERNVRNGYLEGSTTKPTLEMMRLIEASRAFESNVRMIQNHDQAIGQLLSRVLRSS